MGFSSRYYIDRLSMLINFKKSIEPKGGLFKKNLEEIEERSEAGVPSVIAQIIDYLLGMP